MVFVKEKFVSYVFMTLDSFTLQCIENLTQSNDFPIMRGYRNLSSPQIICKFDHIGFGDLRELFYSTVQGII